MKSYNQSSERVGYIDTVAGIMIIWMILGHCRFHANYSLPFFKYLGFYMPWFFYKSGMFFSTLNQKSLFKKDLSKLLSRYIIYSLYGWLIWSTCGIIDGSLSIKKCIVSPLFDFIHHGSIYGNGALWFLLSLFFVRQLANWLLKQKLPPPILSLFFCALAFLLYAIGWYQYSWWLGNILSGTCFFILGNWLRSIETKRWVFFLALFTYFVILLASIEGWIEDFPYMYMHANKMNNGNYLLFYPMSLAGIIVINNIFKLLCKYIRFRVFDYVGYNSMQYYVTHWIFLIIVLFVAKYVFNVNDSFEQFIILLGACMTLLPIVVGITKSMMIKNVK